MVQLIPQEQEVTVFPQGLLSLQDAGVADGAFAMRELNEEHLESLELSDHQKWTPILITLSSAGYIVIDGYHRWEVAKRQNWELKAICRAFSDERQVIEAAFRANLRHGLRASAQTRGDYAYWLFLTYPDLSQQEIAERAGLTQGAVSKAIAKREEAARQTGEERDGHDESEKIEKDCKKFARSAIRFIQIVGKLDDEELSRIILSSVREPEDKACLERIGRLLLQRSRSQFIRH